MTAAYEKITFDPSVERAESCIETSSTSLGASDARVIALTSLARDVRPTTVNKLQGYRYLAQIDQTLNNQPKADALTHFVTAQNASYHYLCCGATA